MISIIIPARNCESSLSRCLESLANQDYRGRKEIIVADDGSTDSTAAVARKFRGVKLISLPQQGPAAARNAGAKASSGSILLFTDADCVPEKNWIREMARPFSGSGVAGVQGVYRTRQKELMARFSQIEIEDRYARMSGSGDLDFIGTYSAAYRRDIFEKFGGFDESFPLASGEDPELSFRVSKAGYRLILNPAAIVYHTHPSTLSGYLHVKFYRAYWRVRLYSKHKSKVLSESYTPQGLKLQIALFSLFFLSLLLSLLLEPAALLATALYLLLLASTLPFSAKAFKKDRRVGLISPAILQLRSVVFAMGLLEATVRGGWRA